MGRYSISEIEKLSGVRAQTIRMWEKRYALRFLSKKRTETNIRFYDDDDLKYLMNIAFLTMNGVRISKAAEMEKEEINAKVNEINRTNTSEAVEISALIVAMTDFDEVRFEKQVTSCMLKYGVESTMEKIIYPFLEKIGIMWQTGSINPAQEHFISNLVRQKLLVATDGLPAPDFRQTRRYLLFLPEGELHEIGLLFANYTIRSKNLHTLYLGQSVPVRDLIATNEYYKADFLFTIITSALRGEELMSYIMQIASRFPKTSILMSGNALKDLAGKKLPPHVSVIHDFRDTLTHLEANKTSAA